MSSSNDKQAACTCKPVPHAGESHSGLCPLWTPALPWFSAYRIDALARDTQPAEREPLKAEGYESLAGVLQRAFEQAAFGKGKERHADDAPFADQPMQKLIELYGPGFALGQAAKKAQESQRLPHDRAIAELLGSIVYLAGAVVAMEREAKTANSN